MSAGYFYGNATATRPKRATTGPRPAEQRGIPETGRIAKLFVGQGYGFIRLPNDGQVYFHRSDLQGGASINDFTIGDAVAFERLDDVVSGARALRVRHSARPA
jgi:hypothetical protein